MVEETICSDIAKGQFRSEDPSFDMALIRYCVKSFKITLSDLSLKI